MSDHIATVLVADDDITALTLMQVALENAHLYVTAVADGEAAVKEHERNPFDLIMLDADMPGMGGLAACLELRKMSGPSLPIVIVTGMDDSKSINAAYEAGATDFLPKPVPWALVAHRARYLLRNYRVHRDLLRSEARNDALLRALPDPCLELDGFGYICAFHVPTADAETERPAALIGKNVYEAFPHEAAIALTESMREALARGTAARRMVALNLDGTIRPYEVSVARKSADPSMPNNFVVLAREVRPS